MLLARLRPAGGTTTSWNNSKRGSKLTLESDWNTFMIIELLYGIGVETGKRKGREAIAGLGSN